MQLKTLFLNTYTSHQFSSVCKKEKCEHSQLWSIDWCGEKRFGHRASHYAFYNIFLTVLIETMKKKLINFFLNIFVYNKVGSPGDSLGHKGYLRQGQLFTTIVTTTSGGPIVHPSVKAGTNCATIREGGNQLCNHP